MCVDYAEYSCANYPWHTVAWQTSGEYGVQGVFGADPGGVYGLCARSQAGALCQGASEGDLHGYVSTLLRDQGHIIELYLLVQMVATILAAFVQVGVKEWIFKNVEGICQKNQPSQLTCPHNQVFFTASAVWCVDSKLSASLPWADQHAYSFFAFSLGVSSDQHANSAPGRSTTPICTPSSSARSSRFPSGTGSGVTPNPGCATSARLLSSTACPPFRLQWVSTTLRGSPWARCSSM